MRIVFEKDKDANINSRAIFLLFEDVSNVDQAVSDLNKSKLYKQKPCLSLVSKQVKRQL